MKRVNAIVYNVPGSTAGTTNGPAIDTNQWINASFQAIFPNGDEAGTVKLQASNDQAPQGFADLAGFMPTNWTDIPDTSETVASGAGQLISLANMAYRWVRVVWTRTGGGVANKNIVIQTFSQGV